MNRGYEIRLKGKAPDIGVIVMSMGLGCAIFVFAMCMLVSDPAWIAYTYILCHLATMICTVCTAKAGISLPAVICTAAFAFLAGIFSVILCAGLVFHLGIWMMVCFAPTAVVLIGAAIVIVNCRR